MVKKGRWTKKDGLCPHLTGAKTSTKHKEGERKAEERKEGTSHGLSGGWDGWLRRARMKSDYLPPHPNIPNFSHISAVPWSLPTMWDSHHVPWLGGTSMHFPQPYRCLQLTNAIAGLNPTRHLHISETCHHATITVCTLCSESANCELCHVAVVDSVDTCSSIRLCLSVSFWAADRCTAKHRNYCPFSLRL